VRILVDNGEYRMSNRGDLAMLDVTIKRLSELWPGAEIGVLTSTPAVLRLHQPTVDPVRAHVPSGPAGWLTLERLSSRLPEPALRGLLELVVPAEVRARAALRPVKRAARNRLGPGRPANPNPAVGEAHPAVESVDLVLAMGGGYLTDVDPDQTRRTLANLELAQSLGVPTAMAGQGIGPLEDPELRDFAARVLPRVELIGLREARRGPAILAGLGVPSDRIVITGDDAIELAEDLRPAELGSALGVNARVAAYTPLDGTVLCALRDAVQTAAGVAGAPLVPLHISDEDPKPTRRLTRGYRRVAPTGSRVPSAADLARRVGLCRVILTCVYHASVFALSQGVPVVAVSASEYAADKFLGLAGQFERGITVIDAGEPGLERRVRDALERSWTLAPHTRDELLASAGRQAEASRALYRRIYELVEERRHAAATLD
jgi:polysaccharide pyruvyl transferase WcaK-like protein